MNLRSIAIAALAAATTFFAIEARAQEADLSVMKSAPATAAAGTNVSFDITVTNIGPDPSLAVTLDDNLPAGMSFVSFTQNSGPTFSCSTPNTGDTSGTVNCTIAALPANTPATFTFVAQIDLMTAPGTTFTNSATASAQTFDPNDENNTGTASVSTPPPPQADIAVSKNGPSMTLPGNNVVYTIVVTNAGPATGTNLTLTDTLPGTMTFVSLSQSGPTTFGCTMPAVGAGGTITCTAASMAANTSTTFQLTGNVPADTPLGTTFENSVTVGSDQDPNEENNSGSTVLTVNSADVSITKTAPPMATSGTDISFVITMTNNGPGLADSPQWNDTLPAGLTFVSLTYNSGAAANCVTPAVDSTGTVSCSVSNLLPGQSSQYTLTAHIGTNPPPSTISNTVQLSPSPSDPDASNNVSNTTTTVVNVAELGVTKNGPASIQAGSDIPYTISVTQTGPSPASSVTLTDTTPANTTFVSLAAPMGWSCTTPAVGGTGTINCSIATLAPNTTSNFTLTLHAAPSAPNGSTIMNTVTVASPTDTTTGNNTASSSGTVTATSDVQLTKNGPAAAASTANVAYTVVVTNAGPADAQNVVMTDTVPTGSTFVSISQTGAAFNCTAPPAGGTGPISCSIPTLTFGASTTFTITVTTPPATTTTLNNTATVTTSTTDPNPLNNTASTTTVVSPNPADLSIVKTSNAPSGTLPNSQLTYTLLVTNNGPSTANGVSVTDTLPANTTLSSANSTQGSCSGTTTVTCTVGTLTSGATATITIVVTVGPDLGPIVNTATVASTNPDPDPNPANNTDSDTVNVVPTIPSSSPLSLTLLALGLSAAGLFAMRLRS